MVKSLAVKADSSKKLMADYAEKVNQLTLHDLVAEFFSYLDYTEESDSGRVFHPIEISSCRILMHEPLAYVLHQMRKRVDGYAGVTED
jgi:hypothetical protein